MAIVPARTIAKRPGLVQPILLFELARQVLLRQELEVLVGEGVELVLEPAREHPLDLGLPALLLEPRVAEELFGAGHVLVVQLDADVARQLVGFGVRAREPDELGLRDGHALALEGQVDRALLDDRVDVVAPRVVVHEHVDRQLLLVVQPPRSRRTPRGGCPLPVSSTQLWVRQNLSSESRFHWVPFSTSRTKSAVHCRISRYSGSTIDGTE